MTMTQMPPAARRRGSVIVIVLWTIAVAALITSSVQLFTYRQATLGREALARTQARWAARSGVENTMAVMAMHTQKPFANDAKAMTRDMFYVWTGQTLDATYEIYRDVEGVKVGGPADEHAKININRAEDRGLLLALEDMSFDLIDAINDWLDEDDELSPFGVERDYYLSLESPYEPRNGPVRTLGEIELIAGIWPTYFRGEDWNLNGRLDANENDGGHTFPPDQPDGILESGWAGSLTVYSTSAGATASGLPRIRLRDADPEELQERLGVGLAQAEALIRFGSSDSNDLADLVVNGLNSNAGSQEENEDENGQAGQGGQQNQNRNRNQRGRGAGQQQQQGSLMLTPEQLRAVLAETCIEDPAERRPGKMNINTVPERLLRDILEILGMEESVADEIIYLRESRPEGIVSPVDLLNIPDLSAADLQNLLRRFDTTSNVFTITSRGRSNATGVEVEIIAVVDRSTVPVRIIEYREQ